MNPDVSATAFYLLAAIIIGSALAMVFSRNVVHAAYWLLGSMLATAGVFLLLSYEFIALVQVLVYAGAVAVLILFVVMLTLRRREDAVRSIDFSPWALGLAAAVAVAVFAGLRSAMPQVAGVMPDAAPDVARIGELMFTEWVLPFEIASLVLLVALVGAIWWSGGERR